MPKKSKRGKKKPELNFIGGDMYVQGEISGLMRLGDKFFNKDTAFTIEERQLLGIHGLLPPVVRSIEEQVELCLMQFLEIESDLLKFSYMLDLLARNERLFYKFVATHLDKCLPIIYTPTVGQACLNAPTIYEQPVCLFITIEDKGHVYDVLKNWPQQDVRVICVTDGGRILGLGDLGAHGYSIPKGKVTLYTALGKVRPQYCLPVCLDVGCNKPQIRDDPLYMGLKRKRPSRTEYDEFVDEFMEAVVSRYGPNCLVQFEDIGNTDAFRLLTRYRFKYSMFNDDIQGAGVIALAGITSAVNITNIKLEDHRVLFQGAGEAALGIANLLLVALKTEGLNDNEARSRIWLRDSKGLVAYNRPQGHLTEYKLAFARRRLPIEKLEDCVREIKPTILIGVSAQYGAFTREVLELMALYNKTPVIFAMSNPPSKAECTAEAAFKYTRGKCIFASGSPSSPIEHEGKTYYTTQVNSLYGFPGVVMGATACAIAHLPPAVFVVASHTISDFCTDEDYRQYRLLPPLSKLCAIAFEIACNVVEYAYKNNLARRKPDPTDIRAFVKHQMYDCNYEPAIKTWLEEYNK
uniref:Malic enzyme n=1 Tax=Glossina brevipalpis TaxID=37001 RepID=A0A1A9WHE5_9MUSC